jgi:transposase
MKTTRKKRSQQDYSLAFKLQVVLEVEKGEITYKQAQKRYGIQGTSTVLVWLRKYGNLDWSLPKIRHLENEQPTPEQRIKQLEASLQEEKDRNLLYKTMIDIVEKEYGLPIRKKYSTKQSKNSDKQKK